MASVSPEERFTPYTSTGIVIAFPIATFALMFLTYGAYLIIFGLSIHILFRRHGRHTSARRLYLWCTVTLFVLNTIHVVFHSTATAYQAVKDFEAAKTKDWDEFMKYLNGTELKSATVIGSDLTAFLMNVIADCMLIHRCYVVWESRKSILYPLAFLSVAVNGLLLGSDIPRLVGIVSDKALFKRANNVNRGAFVAVAAFNFALTLITAGRISWLTREARALLGRRVDTRYKRIVAIIIESGMLYSTTLLVSVIIPFVMDSGSAGFIPVDLSALTIQLSGLAPTLIIVRVAYGENDSGETRHRDKVTSLSFAEADLGLQTSTGVSSSRRTVDNSGPETGAHASIGRSSASEKAEVEEV
ncbi:hypothetical protein PM082_004253 [Marasmius tenuissimus]|nr:hypothetical protein PM082_004253 [Marasmius tenuissimus]